MKRIFRPACALAMGLSLVVPATRLGAAEASPYGVNAHVPEGDDLRLLFDRAEAARIGWVRIDFVWSAVEPVRGVRDYRVYDEIVREARARGLEVYAGLGGTPAWATNGPPETGVPRNVAEWRAFVSDSARRYRGRVKAWGVWNEPNLTGFWAGSKAEYVDVLLRPASEEIRKADPDALVCGPELAHLNGGRGDWYEWLLDILVSARDGIDVVTHHLYDRDGSGDVTRKLDASTTFGGNPRYWDVVTPSVREVLREARAEGKPFWLTETGWASDEVGETSQARFVVDLLADWFGRPGEPSWVKKIFLYELVDDRRAGIARWGLLRPDRSPKPAYTAVSTFMSTYSPYGDAALGVSAEIPGSGAPGVPSRVRMTLRNVGRSTWTREAGHALAPLGDAPLLSPGRVPLPSGRPVAPGESATFDFTMVPPREGTFLARWRLVSQGGTQFGPELSRTVTVTGACPAPPAPTVTAAPAGAAAEGSLAVFAWSASAGPGPALAKYRVRLETSAGPGAGGLVVDSEVAGPSFAWKVSGGAGATADFRVAAVNACGATGATSPPVTFSVATAGAALVVTAGQGAPWLVRTGGAPPAAFVTFRNVGGEPADVRFGVTDGAFLLTPLSATLGPGEEGTVLVAARPGATSTPGVRAGRVVASWTGGSVSTPVAMAVASGEVGGTRVTASPSSVSLLAPSSVTVVRTEVAVTNPGSAPVLLVPLIEPGGAWLSVATADLATPIPPGGTRVLRLTADRRLRASEDGPAPVRTVLALVAAGGAAADRLDLPVVDAEPAPRAAAPGRGPVPSGFSSWIVPTAVRQGGAVGQVFASSLSLRNFGSAPAAVDVFSTPRGRDGDREAVRASLTVPAAGTLLLDDALPVLFGESDGAAHLEIRGPGSLAVRSVVTGSSPTGGRFTGEIPVVASGEGTGTRRWPLLLPGLSVTKATRCNVILAETTGHRARVALRLFDATGRALGRGEVEVPAWGNTQVSLAAAVGLEGGVPEASSLRVEPLEGEGLVAAIATLVDNVSASFSVVTGRPAPEDANDGAGPQAIASIVQAAGAGSFFTTELAVATAAPNAAPLRLTYEYAGSDAAGAPTRGRVEREVVLPRDGALPSWLGRNVVRSLFGLGPRTNTSGTVRIEGDAPGRVLARAAVSTPADLADPSRGTMTAEFPAVGPDSPEVLGGGASSSVALAGLRSWRRERVNLIVSEVAGAPVRVSLRLLGDGEVVLGERDVSVGPFEKVQLNDLWNGPTGFGLGAIPADRLTLVASAADGGAGRAVLAVTTVDNATNGTLIQLLAPPGPAPLGGPSGR